MNYPDGIGREREVCHLDRDSGVGTEEKAFSHHKKMLTAVCSHLYATHAKPLHPLGFRLRSLVPHVPAWKQCVHCTSFF